MVPVSVRSDAEKMALGNRVSMIFADLPVGPVPPEERLALVREETKGLKDSMMALSAEAIMSLGTWAPPTLHALAARLMSRGRWFNLVISNVPGPQVPMYIAGARMLVSYPVMPLGENVGPSVAVTSLAGTMGFGLTGDWGADPHAPGHLASEPMLGLAGDPHPGIACVLSELLDPAGPCGAERVLTGVLAQIDVGERPDHQDLLPVDLHLRRALEPVRRDPAGQPPGELGLRLRRLGEAEMVLVTPHAASDLLCNGDYQITRRQPFSQERARPRAI